MPLPAPPALALQEQAFIRLPTLRPQYPYAITDQGFNLRGRPFNVTLAWNVMPKVGALYSRQHTFSGEKTHNAWVGGCFWSPICTFDQGWPTPPL